MTPLISLLLPSRKRHASLHQSLASLATLATDPKRVEVLVRADVDDPQTVDVARSPWPFQVRTLVGQRGNGYADLHLMYNELCSHSTGRLLFLWNDDAMMLTPGWDEKLVPFDVGKLCYLNVGVDVGSKAPQSDKGDLSFPIVHRTYYDVLGHYSPWAHNDTYVYWVLQPFFGHGIHHESGINVRHLIHDYLATGDATSVEGRNMHPQTRAIRKTAPFLAQLEADRQKIAAHLASK